MLENDECVLFYGLIQYCLSLSLSGMFVRVREGGSERVSGGKWSVSLPVCPPTPPLPPLCCLSDSYGTVRIKFPRYCIGIRGTQVFLV